MVLKVSMKQLLLLIAMNEKAALRVLGAFACALLIVSMALPFLQAEWAGMHVPEVQIGPDTYWSFKRTSQYSSMNTGFVAEQWWFFEYWNPTAPTQQPQYSGGTVMIMFIFQVLAVFLAALATFQVKPYLFLSSAILSVLTIFCMLLVGNALHFGYVITFQAGFWLTFPPAPMFFVSFLECLRLHRERLSRF